MAGWPTGANQPVAPVALVAGGGDDEGAGGEGALADGFEDLAEGVVDGDFGPERHGDDARALGDGPVDAGEDAAVGAAAVVVEDLAREDGGPEGDAVAGRVVGRLRPAGGADAVGAVAVAVLGLVALDEADGGDGARGEVGVLEVEAGVEDGDLDALAGEGRRGDAGGLEAPGGGSLARRRTRRTGRRAALRARRRRRGRTARARRRGCARRSRRRRRGCGPCAPRRGDRR